MLSKPTLLTIAALACATMLNPLLAAECTNSGPQTPRDIDVKDGTNSVVFSMAPDYREMNLCDVHFHKQAEHKAKDYSLPAEAGDFGGFRCNKTKKLGVDELRPRFENHCSNVAAGDTVEVHWVYTSCDVAPAPGLGSCLSSTSCPNPNLRVEAQVFLLVNDSDAASFSEYDYAGDQGGYHQAKSLPAKSGKPVEYLGSTTGPSYSDEKCSPIQVSWSVRPECAKLDIGSLSDWCSDNAFEQSAAQGMRALVVDPALLSPIE